MSTDPLQSSLSAQAKDEKATPINEPGAPGASQDDGCASEEEEHLASTLTKIVAALEKAAAVADGMSGAYADVSRYMAQFRGELAPEEMQQSRLELARMGGHAEAAHLSLGALEKLMDSPYFARVDFEDDEDEGISALTKAYIGRSAFIWGSKTVVSDWRSPVASLFYDFEPGPASFEAPSGVRQGRLTRKRQIRIERGKLSYAIDTDSSVRDEMLAQALSRTADAKMHDIVSSIQKEQNAIIRNEGARTLVIQGVAGSGKTSIALHRIAYLLYRQKETLTSRSVAIVSPSRVFSNYISEVLPELGEEPVQEWSMHDLGALLVGKAARVQQPLSYADEDDSARRPRAEAKGSVRFAQSLTAWLDQALAGMLAEPLFCPEDLPVSDGAVSAAWLAERFDAYGSLPFGERLDLMAEDVVAHHGAQSYGRAFVRGGGAPKRRDIRTKLGRMMKAKDAVALYRRFLSDTGQGKLFARPEKGMLEWEDAFPVALCRWAFEGAAAVPEALALRHVVIDEMQDLTPIQHAVIARMLPGDKTILGDVDQLVDGRCGLTIQDIAGMHEGAEVVRLLRSYRSTWEIAALGQRVKPTEGFQAVERHGEEPRFVRCKDTLGVLDAIDEALRRWKEEGRKTMGIICKSDGLAELYEAVIGTRCEVSLITDATTVFPEGVALCSVRLAKGLEFDEVILLDVDDRQYATEADRNLLYVAITRALHRITILYRDQPSPLLG